MTPAPGSHLDPALRNELESLLAGLVEGVLPAAKKHRLGEILKGNAEARRFYKHYIEVHAMLEWESGLIAPPSDQETLQDLLRMETQAEAALVHDVGQLQSPFNIRHAAVWGGLAAALAILVTLTFVFTGGPSQPATTAQQNNTPTKPAESVEPIPRDTPGSTPGITPATPRNTVATLTATHNAQWAQAPAEGASAPGSSGPLIPGSKLHPHQRLTLTAGTAEITTRDGAIAILQAPATFELLDNNNALRLYTGKLVGICETDSSKGFLVRTPHMDVTDIGTEFGVYMQPNTVTTTVFSGEVVFTIPPGGESQSITANQTARLRTNGNNRNLVVEDRVSNTFDQLLRPAVVADAQINLPGFKVEVVPRGVFEDARLYTDRTHEMNGVDRDGIPNELFGGDLIRMPADARPGYGLAEGNQSLRLVVEFERHADVYLIYVESETLHPWLTKDYERTGMVVGLDHELREQDRLGVGPGEKIDTIFQVWKRKRPALGRVEIAGYMTGHMYAVIAVPAKEGDVFEE